MSFPGLKTSFCLPPSSGHLHFLVGITGLASPLWWWSLPPFWTESGKDSTLYQKETCFVVSYPCILNSFSTCGARQACKMDCMESLPSMSSRRFTGPICRGPALLRYSAARPIIIIYHDRDSAPRWNPCPVLEKGDAGDRGHSEQRGCWLGGGGTPW